MTIRNFIALCHSYSSLNDLSSLFAGIKCPPPPPLPPNYVCRQLLLDEMVNKLCQSTIGSNSYGTSLTVVGAGGFGKTSLITGLCHHPVVKEKFKDGFLVIKLGTHADDPSALLAQVFYLLTDCHLKQGDIKLAEQEINQLTSLYCHNLLVIIDDVWHVENAEPIVKAFGNCKIVLTTRMNDIEQYIPTKQVVSVGPMEQSEAISLLTCGVIDISKLSQEDLSLLDELAQDVHLWPLLLSLIREQLCYGLKTLQFSSHEAIEHVQAKLHKSGLTGFDKHSTEKIWKHSIGICIERSLKLLPKSVLEKMKTLIMFTGIGTALQKETLHMLWCATENEADYICNQLIVYGLVRMTTLCTEQYIEVHAIISQYIVENIDAEEVIYLKKQICVTQQLIVKFNQSLLKLHGVQNVGSLNEVEYLEFVLEGTKYNMFLIIKLVNQLIITDPHGIIYTLNEIKRILCQDPKYSFEEIDSLVKDCYSLLKKSHLVSDHFNKNVQKFLCQKYYTELIAFVDKFARAYPAGLLAERALLVLRPIIPHCKGYLRQVMLKKNDVLASMTPDYHKITLCALPTIKLLAIQHQQISRAPVAGPAYIHLAYLHIAYGKFFEKRENVTINCSIQLQDIAPSVAQNLVSQRKCTNLQSNCVMFTVYITNHSC